MPPPRAHQQAHSTGPHIESGEDGDDPMPAVGLFDPCGLARRHRPGRVNPLQDLELSLLVGTDDPGAPRGVEIQAYDAADLRSEVRVGTVEPAADAMGLEVGVAQPFVDRALADGADEAPLHGGPSQRANRPMRVGAPEFRLRTAGHRENVMSFFGGKSGLDARGGACRPSHLTDRGQSAPASDAPNGVPAPRPWRSLGCPLPGRPAEHIGLVSRPMRQCVLLGTGVAGPVVRLARVESKRRALATAVPWLDAVFVSPCPQGYVTPGGHRIFRTVH